jgi:hypothetical protein
LMTLAQARNTWSAKCKNWTNSSKKRVKLPRTYPKKSHLSIAISLHKKKLKFTEKWLKSTAIRKIYLHIWPVYQSTSTHSGLERKICLDSSCQ